MGIHRVCNGLNWIISQLVNIQVDTHGTQTVFAEFVQVLVAIINLCGVIKADNCLIGNSSLVSTTVHVTVDTSLKLQIDVTDLRLAGYVAESVVLLIPGCILAVPLL